VENVRFQQKKIRQSAEANTRSNFGRVHNQHFDDILVERITGNKSLHSRIMNDASFKTCIVKNLMTKVFGQINAENIHSQF